MKNLTSLITSLILFASVPVAFAWTAAPKNPPKDNTLPPVTVSKDDQNKLGKLGLGGLAVFGKFQLIDGTQGAGKVLVSDAQGKASWGYAAGGVGTSTSLSQGDKIFPGWPNGIVCNATNGRKKYMYVSGYFPTTGAGYGVNGKAGYLYGEPGDLMSIYFDAETRKSLKVNGNGDYEQGLATKFAPCFTLGTSIDDPVFTQY
ncbi:MAG: hypothetical protein FGM57_01570 [Candidatus Taylorbacteria bacterium]|nr:hypothetical protein [Candidatus Taylorbacteria bacterium]